MAKMGFYEIMTIECLNREYDTKKTGFRDIPNYEEAAEDKKVVIEEPAKSANKGNAADNKKREKKGLDKVMLVVEPLTVMRGHTGYLTFAIKF